MQHKNNLIWTLNCI